MHDSSIYRKGTLKFSFCQFSHGTLYIIDFIMCFRANYYCNSMKMNRKADMLDNNDITKVHI